MELAPAVARRPLRHRTNLSMSHRRRRAGCGLALASLAAANALECAAPCASVAKSCLLSTETLACATQEDEQWRLTLSHDSSYRCEALQLPTSVHSLTLQGRHTRVNFSGVLDERLQTLRLIGLELNTSLPLPDSLTQLLLEECEMRALPLARLLQLPRLEKLALVNMAVTGALTEISEYQFAALASRVESRKQADQEISAEEKERCTGAKGGRVSYLGDVPVCVTPDEATVARRLQTSANSGSGESEEGSASDVMDGATRGSKSAADQDTSTLVMLSMGLPFVYFLYKVWLYVFFSRTWKRDRRESGDAARAVDTTTKNMDIDTTNDSEADRPTANDSSTSPPSSPTPRAHRRQDRKPLSSNNAGFWVDEELQSWRLDFQRLKLLKCLTLLPSEKRQTLRKQSVTSALNPREIWLASYASGDTSTVAVSPGGGTTDSLVVVKFLPPKDGQPSRASTGGGGGGGARNKLKGELKRQAVFSHPQVVAFIGVAWSRETHLVAVTEYMPQGDLRQWLHRTANRQAGKWSVLKIQMLLDVTRALLYLHSMQPRLVHGNCNSRNVLLNHKLRAKMSDFGVEGRSEGLSEEDLLSYSAVGSGRWISPEALLGRETSAAYPDASDVYSLGILIAEVDSHELPFSDLMQANRSAVPETDILQLIAKGALSPTLSPSCPKSIVKLVNACTSYNPKYRPSSMQVQQDLLRILEDFREYESKMSATITVGAPRSNRPSNLV